MHTDEYRVEYIEVVGIVQGVGFRPFIHNLAEKHHLGGYVLNNPDGVVIEIEGEAEALDNFIYDLKHTAPPLSRIIEIKRKTIMSSAQKSGLPSRFKGFEIRDSVYEGQPVTLIPPDVCVCEECLSELFDPENRRYLYPFINCTNCGPRFTIIKGLPYDRPYTTMSGFDMCSECAGEYTNPRDRRFHAQPNACPTCGPHVRLLDENGHPTGGDPLIRAINLLKEGRVLAIKGLGGFHLAVDATSNAAVKRLRLRKNREEKPLAIMVGTPKQACRLVKLGPVEEQILFSRERPILVAPRHGGDIVADAVAPDNEYLGIMMPYTPLHYLLFFHPESGGNFTDGTPVFHALVMTSGNLSEEPICMDNEEALGRLAGIADAFLVHNRDIHVRCDDSVVNVTGKEVSFIRRSRGYVPIPVFLQDHSPPILAVGGELKNTLCFMEGRRAFMSQHIGDLENSTTLDVFQKAVDHFKKMLKLDPHLYAYDLHPEYLSTKYVKQLLNDTQMENLCAVGVQHHHAHIAGVLAEHRHTGPVIGFSMDGTGYGMDGAVWGGEILLCTQYTFERRAHLDYTPLPGAASAIKEPWRMAFSYLRKAFGKDWHTVNLPCLKQVSSGELEVLDQACDSGLNCPPTSSLGRLFDAVASILDLRHTVSYEGQAAIMLEMLAAKESTGNILPFHIRHSELHQRDEYPVLHGIQNYTYPPCESLSNVNFVIDYSPLVRSLAEGIQNGSSRSELAMSFHTTLLSSFLEMAEHVREATGITTVALSGGCWQNRILSERFPGLLQEKGFDVLTNREVPPNDGGLALGQAYVASCIIERSNRRRKECVLQYR